MFRCKNVIFILKYTVNSLRNQKLYLTQSPWGKTKLRNPKTTLNHESGNDYITSSLRECSQHHGGSQLFSYLVTHGSIVVISSTEVIW